MRLHLVAAGLLAAGCASPTTAPLARATAAGVPREASPARVTKVVDGDTLHVSEDGRATKVRILEINTPEVSDYGGRAECFGAEASAFARRMLPVGSTVYLLADRDPTDRYGRALRYVWTADGVFYDERAVREGYARALMIRPNDRYIAQIDAAETDARAHRRGLWSACRS